jgi:hypothetical protein
MPYREPSRPRPDCLTPPNGVTSVESMPVLMPTMLEAFFSALREGCTPTPGPERLGDPPPCHRRHQELARKTAGESLRDHCGVALTGAFIALTDAFKVTDALGDFSNRRSSNKLRTHDKADKPEATFSRMRSSTTYASTWKAIAKRSRTYSLCALSSVDYDQEGHFLIQAFLLALGRSVRNRLKHRLTTKRKLNSSSAEALITWISRLTYSIRRLRQPEGNISTLLPGFFTIFTIRQQTAKSRPPSF